MLNKLNLKHPILGQKQKVGILFNMKNQEEDIIVGVNTVRLQDLNQVVMEYGEQKVE